MKTLWLAPLLVMVTFVILATLAGAQAPSLDIVGTPRIETAAQRSATIVWNTNESSSSRVWYGRDRNNLTDMAEAPYGGREHRVVIRNLQPGTTYYFQVESGQGRHTADEAESRGVMSFRTAGEGQGPIRNEQPGVAKRGLAEEENGSVRITQGPVVERVEADSAVIAWSTNLKGSSRVNYGTSPNNLTELGEAPWGQGGLTHRVTLHNLKPDTNYYFAVETGQAQGTGGAEVESNRVQSFKTRPRR